MFLDSTGFTEWYHYALLLLWLIMLMAGLKYFPKIESSFKVKNAFSDGNKYGVGLLTASFILGFVVFLIWTFTPDFGQSTVGYVIMYGLITLLLSINAYVSFKFFVMPDAIYRLLVILILMIVYFYSGMLGGLLLIAIFASVVIIYALFRLKKTLTIR
jgi:hypothetical protein